MKKPWAGRFSKETSSLVDSFTESISFDKRLWRYDIEGSIAHARMLAKQKIIPATEAKLIIRGLEEIASEIGSGRFKFSADLEDIHMNIESALVKKIGPAGKRLHTARSRNDQIALDLRLYLKSEIITIDNYVKKLQIKLVSLADIYEDVIMPGYTHMQRAQPVLLAHHLLAYVEMFGRDRQRLIDCLKRIDILPLGACALAGTTLPIDRAYVAKLLGFKSVSANSMDSVSDRDFALEFLCFSSLLAMHLSRLAEELVLWSTEEFGFIEIADAFTTGSSIMPQKKNPDVAELIRGKTGRIYGNMLNLFVLMKALPLTYNRDLQEDKPAIFDSVDTIKASLSVLVDMLQHISFRKDRMKATSGEGYSTATDMAEYLVRKGIPFREAHEITGKVVLYSIKQKKTLLSLKMSELRSFSNAFDKNIYRVLDPDQSVKARKSSGGTAPAEVKKQIKRLKRLLK